MDQAHTMLGRMPHMHDEIKLSLPPQSFRRAMQKDVELVKEIVGNLKSQYNPMAPLEKMKVSL
jgi:hypothetical protein